MTSYLWLSVLVLFLAGHVALTLLLLRSLKCLVPQNQSEAAAAVFRAFRKVD